MLVPRVLSAQACTDLAEQQLGNLIKTPGSRCLLAQPWCVGMAQELRSHPALSRLIPEQAVAVQCTYFEKSSALNWLVPLHQDLSIPVASRIKHPELRGWAVKEDSIFVQPPVEVLEQMVAVRLHLDDCSMDDGPLLVVQGSHLGGRLDPEMGAFERGAEVACTAEQGTALVMRPLLLHRSSKSTGSSRRRVLHFLFGPAALPYGLQWQTAV